MEDLYRLSPAMQSVSIVPAGLTRFRDGLAPLTLFSEEECREVVRTVEEFGERCLAECGSRVFFPSDEFYVRGGLPLRDEDFYEGYPQIENGVGMLTSLETEFGFALEDLSTLTAGMTNPRRVSVATGVAAYDYVKRLCEMLSLAVPLLDVSVYRIENHFFGETITVAGLLTGKDMSEQLLGKDLGDELLIPENTLRSGGDIFLCDMTVGELSEKLGVRVTPAPNDGEKFARAVLGVL